MEYSIELLLVRKRNIVELFLYHFNSMGCSCSIQFYAQDPSHAQIVFQKCLAESTRLDQYYSNFTSTSFTAEINRHAGEKSGIIVDNETAGLLDYAEYCYEMSDGLFDITAGILQRAWNFKENPPKLPTQSFINKLLKVVGWKKVIWKKPKLILPFPGMLLDFGGVVKEYAADCLYSICKAENIHHGIINMSGDMRVIGPHVDGRPWEITIGLPRNETGENPIKFSLSQGAVATSGDYEKSIVINGKHYCHILNPKTGWPVSGLSSVTAVTDLCIVAGSVTTTALLKGKRGLSWLKTLEIPFYCYDEKGRLLQ